MPSTARSASSRQLPAPPPHVGGYRVEVHREGEPSKRVACATLPGHGKSRFNHEWTRTRKGLCIRRFSPRNGFLSAYLKARCP